MGVKEKAKNLVEKMDKYAYRPSAIFNTNFVSEYENAKRLALICIDEQQGTLLSVIGSQGHMWSEDEVTLHKELQEMKEEIKKL